MTEHTPSATSASAESAQRVDRIFEVISAVLLGIVALATAWSGYQAARWSGEQAAFYNQAAARRVQASSTSTQAGQLTGIDVGTFSNWVNAYAEGNQELADFYQKRFRPEFLPAFDAWVATRPRLNPDAPPSPFVMPEYQLQARSEADRLEAEANHLFEQGQTANDISDQYVLVTVILASVLFFVAIEERFDWTRVRAVILVIAFSLLAYGLFNLATLPIM